jgi:hypothetical protein
LPEGIVAKAYSSKDKMVGFVVTGDQAKTAFPLMRELQTA